MKCMYHVSAEMVEEKTRIPFRDSMSDPTGAKERIILKCPVKGCHFVQAQFTPTYKPPTGWHVPS
jgi:hypothetical protein